jgi:hypothetical protein
MTSRQEHYPGNIISLHQTAPTSLLICNIVILDLINVTEDLIMGIAFLSIYLSIYLWLYSPLLDLGRFFSFLTFLHSRLDSLDGGSACRKAAS